MGEAGHIPMAAPGSSLTLGGQRSLRAQKLNSHGDGGQKKLE